MSIRAECKYDVVLAGKMLKGNQLIIEPHSEESEYLYEDNMYKPMHFKRCEWCDSFDICNNIGQVDTEICFSCNNGRFVV